MLFLPLDRGASQSRSCLARSGETKARASWWTSCLPRSTSARAARAATTPGTPSSFRWAPKTQRRRSRSISFRAVRARSLLSFLLSLLSHSWVVLTTTPDLGLINPKCTGLIGSGVVVHVPSFFAELDQLQSQGTFGFPSLPALRTTGRLTDARDLGMRSHPRRL